MPRPRLSAAERLGVPAAVDEAPASIVNERLYIAVDSAIQLRLSDELAITRDRRRLDVGAADRPRRPQAPHGRVRAGRPSTSCRRLEHQLSRLLTGTIGSTRAPVDDG